MEDERDELVSELSRAQHENSLLDRRIETAVALVTNYGDIDGAHHKQWVLDQTLRALLGEHRYQVWRTEYELPDADGDYCEWNEGIAP